VLSVVVSAVMSAVVVVRWREDRPQESPIPSLRFRCVVNSPPATEELSMSSDRSTTPPEVFSEVHPYAEATTSQQPLHVMVKVSCESKGFGV